ncbi:MAG: NusG domain II-containing protein [Treponema sp.]|nr:NusG domain II-containing protein [Treponema sp.]
MGTIITDTITTITIMDIKSRTRLFAGSGMKGGDFVVLALALGALVFSAARVYAGPSVPATVTVQAGGSRWVFPLEEETVFTAQGPLGDTVVELRGKSARVLSSPCTNQTCVAQGSIHGHGQWLACLPNRVMVSISGGGEEELDSVVW